MIVSATKWNEWDIVGIEGEFVVKHLMSVREHLEEYTGMRKPRVAFDLSRTTYIDSSAITLMLNYQKRLKELGGTVVIFGVGEDMKSIFSIVGLDTSIVVYDTREQFERAVQM